MTRWFTADTHFSHFNILEYCKRPFKDINEMNNKIISNINELVSQEDELWILGDLAMGLLDSSLPILKRIHAKKIIVAGNHDRCHPYYGKKSESFIQKYIDDTGAMELFTTNTSLILMDGTQVAVSHFPYQSKSDLSPKVNRNGKTTVGDKFSEYRVKDEGGWLLCGHVHEKWAVQDKQINVGIDAWGGHPVSEETLVGIIASGISEKSRIVWE